MNERSRRTTTTSRKAQETMDQQKQMLIDKGLLDADGNELTKGLKKNTKTQSKNTNKPALKEQTKVAQKKSKKTDSDEIADEKSSKEPRTKQSNAKKPATKKAKKAKSGTRSGEEEAEKPEKEEDEGSDSDRTSAGKPDGHEVEEEVVAPSQAGPSESQVLRNFFGDDTPNVKESNEAGAERSKQTTEQQNNTNERPKDRDEVTSKKKAETMKKQKTEKSADSAKKAEKQSSNREHTPPSPSKKEKQTKQQEANLKKSGKSEAKQQNNNNKTAKAKKQKSVEESSYEQEVQEELSGQSDSKSNEDNDSGSGHDSKSEEPSSAPKKGAKKSGRTADDMDVDDDFQTPKQAQKRKRESDSPQEKRKKPKVALSNLESRLRLNKEIYEQALQKEKKEIALYDLPPVRPNSTLVVWHNEEVQTVDRPRLRFWLAKCNAFEGTAGTTGSWEDDSQRKITVVWYNENENGDFELLPWDTQICWGQVVCTTRLVPCKEKRGSFSLPAEEVQRIEQIMDFIDQQDKPVKPKSPVRSAPVSPGKSRTPLASPSSAKGQMKKKPGPKATKTVALELAVKPIQRLSADWPELDREAEDVETRSDNLGKVFAYLSTHDTWRMSLFNPVKNQSQGNLPPLLIYVYLLSDAILQGSFLAKEAKRKLLSSHNMEDCGIKDVLSYLVVYASVNERTSIHKDRVAAAILVLQHTGLLFIDKTDGSTVYLLLPPPPPAAAINNQFQDLTAAAKKKKLEELEQMIRQLKGEK